MDLSFWAATDIGRKRTHNEDNFLVDQKLSLFVVADGMGGHASGEIASQMAVNEFRSAVDSRRDIIDAYGRHDTGVTTHDVLGVLEYAVQTAGLAIFERGQKEPEKRGMGTTISAFLLIGERGFIAHVGDSRVYMVRSGQTVQLDRGSLAHQRADPAWQGHARDAGEIALRLVQERGHARSRGVRNGPGRHHRPGSPAW